MSKTNIILLVSIALILLAGGVGLFFMVQPKNPTTPKAASLTNDLNQTPLKESITADKTYEDTAGFSFKHPRQFTVSDITPDDDSYYTKLQITSSKGNLTFAVTDTTYETLADWQGENKTATLVGASLLGDIKANQYKMSNLLLTIAVDRGVLYVLESTSDAGVLDETHSIISSSVKFADQKTTTTVTSTEEVEYEPEEVIE